MTHGLITYQVDAFTRERFRGNPAGVVLNADGLTDQDMQLIARELNNSETAFLFAADDGDCDGIIRYFTPLKEVPICGHATIAAMYAKAHEESLGSCVLRMKTKVGVLPFEIIRENGDYSVIMTQGELTLSKALDEVVSARIENALGLSRADRDGRCPMQIASTGHSKVMVGITSRRVLNGLSPNMLELSAISREIGCNGYFVFTLDSDDPGILCHGRMFAPAIGIAEDPVTGNANGPLGGYLIRNGIVEPGGGCFEFKARQGDAIRRPGVIGVRVELANRRPVRIQITGTAVMVFRAVI